MKEVATCAHVTESDIILALVVHNIIKSSFSYKGQKTTYGFDVLCKKPGVEEEPRTLKNGRVSHSLDAWRHFLERAEIFGPLSVH